MVTGRIEMNGGRESKLNIGHRKICIHFKPVDDEQVLDELLEDVHLTHVDASDLNIMAYHPISLQVPVLNHRDVGRGGPIACRSPRPPDLMSLDIFCGTTRSLRCIISLWTLWKIYLYEF